MQKQEALDKIKSLVERFDEQKELYKHQDYNETQTRRDFIDPFWKALGWDVDNENGYAESYREVIHEDRIKIGGATKAPDYSFRLVGGKRLFFLEAKKPSVAIKDEIAPAYQVRRYGWSAKMPISVITDFEEFAVYDCTNKPKPTDKASNGRIKYLTYKEYISEFDFIWDTFAKERVLKGSFDKYIASDKNKKGTSSVDNEFLHSLDKWRVVLAMNIALRNKDITEDELNFVVQHTIDRIIFLRIAEDRSVESYGNMQTTIKNGDFYQNLLLLFHQADQKYNSGLFDFEKDKISTQISIDNKVIKSIIAELYYPICPYEFSVLSVEILGSAYEQFLGKQISLTAGGRAKIEEKPEVRKAGGVYYTPQYIVDYIVKNTVGKLVENKTPKEVNDIKICDPACGSGSFLIGAYQFLLDWHKDFYTQNGKPSKGSKNNPLTPMGELTTAEKSRILLNNIYGVDIDSNAVEVTKLSLLLKCMEGETKESIETQTKLFHNRILPTLDNNIKSGNSLIDFDYYDNELDFGEERKIKPFSWQKAFPEVFNRTSKVTEKENLSSLAQKAKHHAKKAMEYATELEEKISHVSELQMQYGIKSGFDCIIGNPPWVSLSGKFGNDILNEQGQQYLTNKYKGNTYMPNLYEYFVHKGLDLINLKGVFSFIIPDRLGFNNQFISLRKKLLEQFKIEELLYKAPFPGIVTDTLIFRFTNKKKSETNYQIVVGEFGKSTQIKNSEEYLQDKEFRFVYESCYEASKILNKIFSNEKCKSLGEIADTTSGFGGKSKKITTDRINEKQIEVIRGRSIQKFSSVIPFYFEFIKDNITGRTTDKNKLGVKEKVLLRKTGFPIIATYDKSGIYPEQSLYFIFNNKTNNSLKYFTALINSNLFQFVYINKLVTNKDSTPQLKKVDLDKFPVLVCDKSNKEKHDKIIKLVDQLLQLNKDKQNITLPNQLEMINNRIEYAESKINELVYQLYDLTEEEIKIIEKQ